MGQAVIEKRRVVRVMGTAVGVSVPGGCAAGILDEVFDWLRWVDKTFSVHSPDSEISRLSVDSLREQDCHPLVSEVLDRCIEMLVRTDGWFDASPDGPRGRLDPSGLVKGWSVDRAAAILGRAGVSSYCINAGGDILACGGAGDGRPWRIGIQHPLDGNSLAAVLEASDLAVATSGQYERGSHIWPVSGGAAKLLSATVVGPDLTTADVLATALFAADGAADPWFGRFGDYDYLTIGSDRQVRWTPALDRYLV
jgi:thiamine biosynthesis lipoprotein